MKNPTTNTSSNTQAMSFVTAAMTAGVEANRAARKAVTKAQAMGVPPALAAKLANASAPQTAAPKAATKAATKAVVQSVDTAPAVLSTKTEAYKLFTALEKSNEAIYAFFAAHEADLFKEVATGRQLDAASAYKKFFEVNHSRGAAVPLKAYPLYKEFTNKLAYWVKNVAVIKSGNVVGSYLAKHEDDEQAIPAIKAFIAKVMAHEDWTAFKTQIDAAFAGIDSAPRVD